MFNDLLNKLESEQLEVFAYADDLAIVGETNAKLKMAMGITEKWALDNLMKINKKKSGIIYHKINGKKLRKKKEYHGYPIMSEYKYLGIVLDSKLSFKPHLEHIRNKINNGFKLINIMNWKKLGTWWSTYVWMTYILLI